MKRKTLMIVLGIFACLVPFGLFANAASSEPSGWGVAQLIEHDDLGSASYPDIGTDAMGNAIAVWNQNDEWGISQIVANRYTKGIGWGDAEFLVNGGTHSMSPRIAMNGRGNGTVIWSYSDGIRDNIAAMPYHPDIGWGYPVILDIGDGSVYSHQVDMNDDGYAVAVWGQLDSGYYNIKAAVYMPGIGWGSPTNIEENNGGAYGPQVAISPDGDAIAVWYQDDGSRENIWANRFSLTTGWGTAELIEAINTGDALDPRIDMDASGNAVVVWRHYDGSIFNVVSNRYTAGTGWGTAEIIETGDGQVQPPINVAVDNEGYALAVWQQWDGSKYDIISNRFTPGEGWGEEEVIEDGAGNAETSHIDMDASGNAIAVWRQVEGFPSIFANRFVKGNGWGKAEVLETRLFSADVPRVSVDPSGDAIAVWYQYDGYRFNIWSNRYVAPDTTPPVLTLSSPENGIESNTNAVTVSGITEPGSELDINGMKATVKSDGSFSLDLFLYSGENTIVVTSTDASGNHAVMTRTVTYTDPLVDEIASLTNALNDLSLSLSSILGNISDIEDDITSIKEMMGTMNTSDNTSSIMDELEVLSKELEMAKENLTSLKERLSAIEGEGNETVDLSGILDMIDALENDIDRNEAEISTLKNDVSSLTSDVDALKDKEPSDDDDLDKKVSNIQSLVTVLGAVLFISIIIGILFFIVLLVLSLRSKGRTMEE